MVEVLLMSVQKLTREQAAIVGLYTGVCCGPFEDIHELAEKILEREVKPEDHQRVIDSFFDKVG